MLVTPFAADTLSPRVEIVVDDSLPGVATVTVLQVSGDKSIPVREGERRPANTAFVVVDHETPADVPVFYRLEMFDALGNSLGLTPPVETQVHIPSGYAVFQDPLAPRAWVMVRAEVLFAEQLAIRRSIVRHRRGDETIALMGPRGLLEDISLRVVTETATDRDQLETVLSQGTILVRTPPPFPLPRQLYAVVPDSVRLPHNARFGGTVDVWDLVGDEVTRSDLAIIEPVLLWSRYEVHFDTWAEAKAVYSTWLEAKRNPPPEL